MQVLHRVNIDTIESRIFSGGIKHATVDQFYEFGVFLGEEIRERIAHLDSKLANILGWSGAILAFLLFDARTPPAGATRVLLVLAATAAICAFALSAAAVKTKMYPSPSESDWFKSELWDEPGNLRKFHTACLLTYHQQNAILLAPKATRLRRAEYVPAVSVLCVGLSVLIRLIS